MSHVPALYRLKDQTKELLGCLTSSDAESAFSELVATVENPDGSLAIAGHPALTTLYKGLLGSSFEILEESYSNAINEEHWKPVVSQLLSEVN